MSLFGTAKGHFKDYEAGANHILFSFMPFLWEGGVFNLAFALLTVHLAVTNEHVLVLATTVARGARTSLGKCGYKQHAKNGAPDLAGQHGQPKNATAEERLKAKEDEIRLPEDRTHLCAQSKTQPPALWPLCVPELNHTVNALGWHSG